MKAIVLELDPKHPFESGTLIPFPPEDYHHVERVLRVSAGESLSVSDGCRFVYRGSWVSEKKGAGLRVGRRDEIAHPASALHLFISPLSREATEILLRRAAELGVAGISWILFSRSEPHWTYEKVESRFRKLMREAAKAPGRLLLPVLSPPVPFKMALKASNRKALHLFGSLEKGGAKEIGDLTRALSGEIDLWVGPEGDFTAEEREALLRLPAQAISLGNFTYRAEVAAEIAIAFLQSQLGNL